MHRHLFPVILLVLGTALAGGAEAAEPDGVGFHDTRVFVGLWEAIDTFDGSTQRLSITCASSEQCEVRLNDTFFSDCSGGIGFARGEGSIQGGVLSSVLTLTCGSTTLSQLNEFVPDRKNGTLTNRNDSSGLANVFHRISQ